MHEDYFRFYIERGRDPYPRGYLRLYPDRKRLLATNREDLLNALYIGKDLFINIFSEFQRREREYDLIVLDIDDDTLDGAFLKLQYICSKLKQNGINHYRVVFSGSKGFHVYIHFEATRLADYRKACLNWLTKIGIMKYVDPRVIEPNRVIRVPETQNTKSGLYSFIIGGKLEMDVATLDSIITVAKKAVRVEQLTPLEPNVGLGYELAKVDASELKANTMKRDNRGSGVFSKEEFFPPCIQRLMNLCRENVDINHNERMQLCIFLINVGYNDDEICDFYRGLSDYNEKVTMYHIRRFRNINMHNNGCDKMTDLGICCKGHEECPFYPSINTFINKIV